MVNQRRGIRLNKKRWIRQALLSIVVLLTLGQINARRVEASTIQIGCDLDGPENGNVKYYPKESTRGISVTIDEIEPQGVVIVGQDEERVGVSFHVNITSLPGTITYDVPEYRCGGTGWESIGSKNPDLGSDGNICGTMWAYIDSVLQPIYRYTHYECAPKTETVFRSIKEVQVYLEPTQKTYDLLYGRTDKSVPQIYPQIWIDQVWSIGGSGFNWAIWTIDELPYLDALHYWDIQKVNGMIIRIPNPRDGKKFALLAYLSDPEFCGSPGGCDPNPRLGNDRTYVFDVFPSKLAIQFPGQWYIVVHVRLDAAQYGDPPRYERLIEGNPDDDLDRVPSADEALQENFFSHAIISAPCNPAEPHGCTDK
jgi:hypothetical protein